jgi:hypothetical protein
MRCHQVAAPVVQSSPEFSASTRQLIDAHFNLATVSE